MDWISCPFSQLILEMCSLLSFSFLQDDTVPFGRDDAKLLNKRDIKGDLGYQYDLTFIYF